MVWVAEEAFCLEDRAVVRLMKLTAPLIMVHKDGSIAADQINIMSRLMTSD
jgi:hypothetical protein